MPTLTVYLSDDYYARLQVRADKFAKEREKAHPYGGESVSVAVAARMILERALS